MEKIENYASFIYNFDNILKENNEEKSEKEIKEDEEEEKNDNGDDNDIDNTYDAFQNLGTFLPQGLLDPDALDMNDLKKN